MFTAISIRYLKTQGIAVLLDTHFVSHINSMTKIKGV